MVYGIVKQSGGHVWVYSEVDRGTTFKLYFPATTAPAEGPKPQRPVETRAGGDETVLLVEDEQALRAFVATVLRKHGFTVHSFGEPEAALEFARGRGSSVDLLLTDMVLPGMSGKALADALEQANVRCRVLYMSGYTNEVIVHGGVLDSSVSFIQKPFTRDTLLQKILAILESGR